MQPSQPINNQNKYLDRNLLIIFEFLYCYSGVASVTPAFPGEEALNVHSKYRFIGHSITSQQLFPGPLLGSLLIA